LADCPLNRKLSSLHMLNYSDGLPKRDYSVIRLQTAVL